MREQQRARERARLERRLAVQRGMKSVAFSVAAGAALQVAWEALAGWRVLRRPPRL